MTLWIFTSMSLSLLILAVNSPHLLSIILVMLSILVSLMLSPYSLWFSFILVLIFTGGVMILALYTITMTFTDIFSSLGSPATLAIITSLITSTIVTNYATSQAHTQHYHANYKNMTELMLSSSGSAWAFLLTVIYLLVVLLLVLSMLKKEKISLRLLGL